MQTLFIETLDEHSILRCYVSHQSPIEPQQHRESSIDHVCYASIGPEIITTSYQIFLGSSQQRVDKSWAKALQNLLEKDGSRLAFHCPWFRQPPFQISACTASRGHTLSGKIREIITRAITHRFTEALAIKKSVYSPRRITVSASA